MAGRGAPPKDPATRRRRNVAPALLDLPGGAGKHPPLPDRERYSEQTCGWWDTWAGSPQASQFTATDWQRLSMLAPLVEAYFAAPDRQTLGEIRLNEAKLGATPEDRQRLRWRIEGAPEDARKPAESVSPRDRPDPRAGMR